MATIDDLVELIYHEKQEPGSMLCAQHALNSLLQGAYFNAPDLSTIARELDEEEAQYDEDRHGQVSANMDDTGFFSVQVLEKALQVWGLTLIRWRSERMRPYQEHPHAQIAFVLNLEQHWYTLRRFGATSPHPDFNLEHSVGHWFNLNSFLQRPEWISKTYLGMVLQQAEADGYSVFAVVQQNPDAPLAVPLTSADHLAATIPEKPSSTTATSRGASSSHVLDGFEDEDMELQAALQASLMQQPYEYPVPPAGPLPSASISAAPTGALGSMRDFGNTATPTVRTPPIAPRPPPQVVDLRDDDDDDEEYDPDYVPEPDDDAGAVNDDPVAASMARNRAFLARFQREQEAALRESYGDEETEARAAQRRREQEEEEEMIRRAIAESEEMHRARARQGQEDVEMRGPEDEPPVVPPHPSTMPIGHRVYDDEDAELQAALRASLEGVPEGFRMPDTPPTTARPLQSATTSAPAPPPIQREPSVASTQSESDASIATESDSEPPPQEQLSMEEIRRRRLARFGG
ncbi:Josephin-domain-containing protein [Fomitopsis serialis]|uniref:Josephin-domain-containing protein n=1 Tax=Fomitopsis serialis TaxID=139415 RepID=UPI00200824F0|nr:Josephin-domain-containing protein [Neoantrodia serialis]KAH9935644.1 Josephin-domain-containing protein [Neoantrodia serialis]